VRVHGRTVGEVGEASEVGGAEHNHNQQFYHRTPTD
jgi:hypothetical protein